MINRSESRKKSLKHDSQSKDDHSFKLKHPGVRHKKSKDQKNSVLFGKKQETSHEF